MRQTARRFLGGKGVPVAVGTAALLVATIATVPQVAGADTEPTESGGLTEGAVFAMSNASEDDGGNEVVAYLRDADGTLTEQGRYSTGGAGSGSFEDSANGLVLGTSEGEAAPNNLIELADGGQQLLFATNAGSNSISVFQVNNEGLELVDVEYSRGEKPVSFTVNDGVAYVLNSGETFDDLFDADGNVVQNCTTGERPTVSGFKVSEDGDLESLRGSTRRLSNERVSGCAQVSFTPDGEALIVTERFSKPNFLKQQTSDNERLDDEGVIVTWRVRNNGRLGRQRVIDPTGQGPFGFGLMKNGTLITAEQSDGPGGVARGTAASYVFDADNPGALLRSSPAVQNYGTDTCWFVIADDQMIGFATSFFDDGQISSYQLDDLGIVQLINATATGPDDVDDGVATGASDMSFSSDSTYLYQLNSLAGAINVWANNGDGTLTFIEQQNPFPQPAFGPGGGMAAPLGLAAN